MCVIANRKYTEEQRAEATRLILNQERSVTSLARELGISTSTIHRWISDAVSSRGLPHQRTGISAGPKTIGAVSDEHQHLAQIMDRLAELEARLPPDAGTESGSST